jgi:hypothetical protein
MKTQTKIAALLLVVFGLVAGVTNDIHTFTKNVNVKGGLDSFDSDDGQLNISSNCVTDDTDSGASTQVLTGVIPAGATSLGVTCNVNTIIAGASLTTWSLGDGTDADLYGTTLALAAGTTVDESDYTAGPLTQAWSSSAGDLTMTAAAGQFDSGNVTCCSHYMHVTAPSS